MSTINFSQIGEWLKKNQDDIALIVGFVLVALIAFGAGRLTAPPIVRNPIIIDELQNASTTNNFFAGAAQQVGESVKSLEAASSGQGVLSNSEQGLFVASRGGTKYHWPWCSYAKNIKETNQIWFNSITEAQAAGYAPCGCIQSKAPAGYKP